MIEFIAFILGFSLFLYALLAGADFGAGILELLPIGISRDERSESVGKAIGPVWEANHIWLILALVIAFTGFPMIFWFFSDFFHFPLGALVVGIIFRGASFTFMHYDPIQDKSQNVYHWIFGLSSIWCTFWLGIMVGSLMLGDFALTDQDPFIRYFRHWLNPFALTMGLFITVLMVFNAALFLSVESHENKEIWKKTTLHILAILIFTGSLAHLAFYLQDAERWKIFFYNPISLTLITISAFLLFPQYALIQLSFRNFSRLLAGAQLMCIIAAGFAPLFPKIILFRDSTSLDIYQAAAEPSVLEALMHALIGGCIIIFPGYFLLLKIFKSKN